MKTCHYCLQYQNKIFQNSILKDRLRQYYYHHVDFKLFDLDETQTNRLFLLKHAFGILSHLDHNETTECWPTVWQNVKKCFISSYVLLYNSSIPCPYLFISEFLWLCRVAALKSLPVHPFNALIFPILRDCLQSVCIFLSLTTTTLRYRIEGH